MRSLTADEHPACCGPLDSAWPWPVSLPGVHLVTTRFDHALLDDEAFARCGVPMPARLRGAVAKRRAEYLAGRLCARRALMRLDGREAIPGMRDDRAPEWPTDCVGAITHGDGLAAALVAHRREYLGLGLDVERLLDDTEGRRLADNILTPGESARLTRLPPERVGWAVTLTFSLKESLFKALHPLTGTLFYFEHAELTTWSDGGMARLRLLRDLGSEWPAGREVDAQFCLFNGRLLSLVAIPHPGPTGRRSGAP